MYATGNLMELFELREGLKLVLEHNPIPIKINIYLEEIIHMLHKGNLLCDSIIDESMLLIRRLVGPVVHHIYRELSKVVDALAKNEATMDCFGSFQVFVVPKCFQHNLFG